MATSRSRMVLRHVDEDASVICDADSSDHLPESKVVTSDDSDSARADAEVGSAACKTGWPPGLGLLAASLYTNRCFFCLKLTLLTWQL